MVSVVMRCVRRLGDQVPGVQQFKAENTAVDHCHLGQDSIGSGHTGPIIATQGRLSCSCRERSVPRTLLKLYNLS